MVVMVVTACPIRVRGDLSRWLLEISPGVFVGNISARVREHLWTRVTTFVEDGRAIMVYSARNEQGLDFKVHRPAWSTVDCDGMALIMRPEGSESETMAGAPRSGWSRASKHRKANRFS